MAIGLGLWAAEEGNRLPTRGSEDVSEGWGGVGAKGSVAKQPRLHAHPGHFHATAASNCSGGKLGEGK